MIGRRHPTAANRNYSAILATLQIIISYLQASENGRVVTIATIASNRKQYHEDPKFRLNLPRVEMGGADRNPWIAKMQIDKKVASL